MRRLLLLSSSGGFGLSLEGFDIPCRRESTARDYLAAREADEARRIAANIAKLTEILRR